MSVLLTNGPTSIYNYLEIVIASAAVAGIFYKLTKIAIRKLKVQYEKRKKLYEMVEFIFSELNCNHGSSIKDKVNKIEKDILENTKLTKQMSGRQRWMLDCATEPIFECDVDGRCTWVNEKYCQLAGHDVAFFLDHGWKNIIFHSDRERVSMEWESAVKEKRSSTINFRMVSRDNKTIYVQSSAIMTDVLGYIGTLTVIT